MSWIKSFIRRLLPWIFILLLTIVTADISQAKNVTLSWEASPTLTVTGYKILVSSQSLMQNSNVLDVGAVLEHTVNGLNDSEEQWFCVKAYDENGNESICSNIVKSEKIPETVLPELDFSVDVEIMIK